MMETKDSMTSSDRGNDNIIEEFARDFFGTASEDYGHSLPSKNDAGTPVKHRQRHAADMYWGKQIENPFNENPNKLTTLTKDEGDQSFLESSSNMKKMGGSGINQSDNFGQAIMRRFGKLSDEFAILSDRLDKANMPETSKRLVKVLSERRQLMLMLAKMGKPHDGSAHHDVGDDTFKKPASSPKMYDDLRALRKAKSVHWSDEQLGGSIIQEPDMKQRNTITSPERNVNYRDLNYSNDIAPFNLPPNCGKLDEVGSSRPSINRKQQPPAYPDHYGFIQMGHLGRRDVSTCDTQGNLCSVGFGHAVECVNEILNEAAALRKEACYMLWKARYLEQLCDVDSTVKKY